MFKEKTGCHLFRQTKTKENGRGAPLFRVFFTKPKFQGGNTMSINGMGKNPAMEGRANVGYVQVLNINASKTEQKIENKPKQKPKQDPKTALVAIGKELRYNVNNELDQVVVTVVDPSTDKIIKEIPSSEVQKMRARVKDAVGNFVNETR